MVSESKANIPTGIVLLVCNLRLIDESHWEPPPHVYVYIRPSSSNTYKISPKRSISVGLVFVRSIFTYDAAHAVPITPAASKTVHAPITPLIKSHPSNKHIGYTTQEISILMYLQDGFL